MHVGEMEWQAGDEMKALSGVYDCLQVYCVSVGMKGVVGGH